MRANDVGVADLDAGDGAGGHPGEQPGGVERSAVRQHEVDRARGAPATGRGVRARAATPRAQLERRHAEHLADGVVELAHAGEAGRERDIGRRQVGADEQHAGGVRAVRAAERERPGAELGAEQPR